MAKLNSDLSSILAATFLGGSDSVVLLPSPLTARGMSMWPVSQSHPTFPV